ncbi:MAG: tetratricopeptide repeat protein [Muribaculaceae bacterium]|nr:tetratricopeptide repeat protein [Muribaculaceae bacterium]
MTHHTLSVNIRNLILAVAALICSVPAALAQSYNDPMTDALLKAYGQLLDEDPRDPETLFRRASLYYKHNDYIRALDDLNTAIKYFGPDQTDERRQALEIRANVLMAMQKYEQALADLNELIDGDNPNFPLLYERATALYELGRYQEAKTDFNRMLRLNPYSREATLGLARVAVKENNLGTANELADRAVSMTPSDPDIYIRRASVRTLMGDRSGAVDDYITAISLDPANTPRALAELVTLSRADYPAVMAGLSNAIAKAPRNGMFYFIRGMIAQGHCNYLAAIADYDRIINENLDSYPGLNAALAECYYALGRYDIALLNADYAISATDNNAFYYMLKSRILHAQNDNVGALDAAEKALEKEPEMIDALVCKALALLGQGESADASVALSEAAMISAEDPMIAILRGWVLDNYRNQHANAERAWEQVLDMDFDFDNVRSLRGFALLSLGRTDQAESWMERVLNTANDYDGAVNYYAACLYSQMGQTDHALRCMEASLEKGYADYHNWTVASEANVNCSPLRQDPRFKQLLDKYSQLFR